MIGMNSRIIKQLWQLYAQTGVGLNKLICNSKKAVYHKNQGSSYVTSMTPRLAASLAKAKADQEIFRPFMRNSSFISPLLGPLCIFTRVFFCAENLPILNFPRGS
jgi:hypothetical protein